jgi:hypothetical protein
MSRPALWTAAACGRLRGRDLLECLAGEVQEFLRPVDLGQCLFRRHGVDIVVVSCVSHLHPADQVALILDRDDTGLREVVAEGRVNRRVPGKGKPLSEQECLCDLEYRIVGT